MLALADWPLPERRQITGVLTDIDDTLTDGGAVGPLARAALNALRGAGLPVIAVTGRPAGWSEELLRGQPGSGTLPCPLDAIVAENGAVALLPGETRRRYLQDEVTRHANALRLRTAAARVLREVPGATLALDNPGRETDIDHSEHAHLPPDAVARVVALLREEGLTATVSSIHINGWIGNHDKLAGARWMVAELLGRTLDAEADRWVYVGDSTNDQVMFAHFRHSVGVANVARFLPQLRQPPRYVTRQERGAGFAEVASALLQARGLPGVEGMA
jgi:hypothetical protein